MLAVSPNSKCASNIDKIINCHISSLVLTEFNFHYKGVCHQSNSPKLIIKRGQDPPSPLLASGATCPVLEESDRYPLMAGKMTPPDICCRWFLLRNNRGRLTTHSLCHIVRPGVSDWGWCSINDTWFRNTRPRGVIRTRGQTESSQTGIQSTFSNPHAETVFLILTISL